MKDRYAAVNIILQFDASKVISYSVNSFKIRNRFIFRKCLLLYILQLFRTVHSYCKLSNKNKEALCACDVYKKLCLLTSHLSKSKYVD